MGPDFVLSGGLPAAASDSGVLKVDTKQPRAPQVSFRVLTRTHVLEGPSFAASSLGELQSGAIVEVVSEKEEWLEIRSRTGGVGFIPSGNAAPERS